MRHLRGAALGLALIVALGLFLSACGGETSDEPPGGPGLSLPINLANCEDWKDATVDERLATVRQIREFTGGPVAGAEGAEGSTLDDDRAYDYFENYCENEFARGFKLYKLYGRAAAFQGLADQAEDAEN